MRAGGLCDRTSTFLAPWDLKLTSVAPGDLNSRPPATGDAPHARPWWCLGSACKGRLSPQQYESRSMVYTHALLRNYSSKLRRWWSRTGSCRGLRLSTTTTQQRLSRAADGTRVCIATQEAYIEGCAHVLCAPLPLHPRRRGKKDTSF